MVKPSNRWILKLTITKKRLLNKIWEKKKKTKERYFRIPLFFFSLLLPLHQPSNPWPGQGNECHRPTWYKESWYQKSCQFLKEPGFTISFHLRCSLTLSAGCWVLSSYWSGLHHTNGKAHENCIVINLFCIILNYLYCVVFKRL
jgi:hypothetical protein